MSDPEHLDGSVYQYRQHLIDTLVGYGRSVAGATRQVSDFEHAVRMNAINDTAKRSMVRAQERKRK